ncbi:MAG TPA: hypothetical protein VJ692_09465 [Nitrospiraceae bacterium]|nr:hypothetical protein [Nitrospiraceae bacterium]
MITQGLLRRKLSAVLLLATFLGVVSAHAQSGTEFPGTVLSVDVAAGKLAVKREGSGTRFTFVVNEKTQFIEEAKSLAHLKKGDNVNVTYSVVGSQYIVQKIAKGK